MSTASAVKRCASPTKFCPADFPASDAGDKLLDLIYAAKAPYRANAHFVMNRSTQAAIRKMKDGQGNYLWQPSNAPGELPSLMG